jgi:hypothetical protein
MNQTGHRSLAMVRRNIRDGELFREDNATRGAGLYHSPIWRMDRHHLNGGRWSADVQCGCSG